MKILLTTTVLATVLVVTLPRIRAARSVRDLVGLWAYLAAVSRAWPERQLVLDAYRSSRANEPASLPWVHSVREDRLLAHAEAGQATPEARAAEVGSPHQG